MTLRYSDSSGRVSFPSLVCFLMRLEATASKCHLRDILEGFTETKEDQERTPLPGLGKASVVGWCGVLCEEQLPQETEPPLACVMGYLACVPNLPSALFSPQDIPLSQAPHFLITLYIHCLWGTRLNHYVPNPGCVYCLNLLFSHALDDLGLS